MNRRLFSWIVFTLCLCGTASAQPPGPESNGPQTPAWLPRGLFLGTSLEGGAVVPQARLQWQFMFYEARRDSLGVFLEPLVARSVLSPTALEADPFGTVPPGSFTRLSFYSLLASIGYTNHQPSGIEWGFQVGTGPAWFEATFHDSSKTRESYWVGLLDGRVRLGLRPGPVGFGVSVGYGSSYNYKRSSLAHAYVGGLQLGLYADWR